MSKLAEIQAAGLSEELDKILGVHTKDDATSIQTLKEAIDKDGLRGPGVRKVINDLQKGMKLTPGLYPAISKLADRLPGGQEGGGAEGGETKTRRGGGVARGPKRPFGFGVDDMFIFFVADKGPKSLEEMGSAMMSTPDQVNRVMSWVQDSKGGKKNYTVEQADGKFDVKTQGDWKAKMLERYKTKNPAITV